MWGGEGGVRWFGLTVGRDAVEAKADYVLVLPCAYFGPQTSRQVIMRFYEEVAEKSPLPIVIVSN